MFRCNFCDKSFARSDNLSRHLRETCIHKPSTSRHISYKRAGDDMQAPKKTKVTNVVNCEKCNINIPLCTYSSHLKSLTHKKNCIEDDVIPGVQIISSAFKRRIASYRLTADITTLSTDAKILLEAFIENIQHKIINLIEEKLREHFALKVNFELFGLFAKPTKTREEEIVSAIKSFVIPYQIVDQATDFQHLIHNLIELLKKKLEEFQVSRYHNNLIEILYLNFF